MKSPSCPWALLCALLCCALVPASHAAPWDHGPLQVSANGRYLQHSNGTPFLWIADTAWELPKQLTMSETETYFQNRKNKGYSVIQLAAIGGNGGWSYASKQTGTVPFTGGNPAQPNAAYWSYMDWIVDKAAQYDLYLLFLPTWGTYVAEGTYFNDTTAYNYGAFLGNRYKTKPNIIWCLGGDKSGALNTSRWTNMANGIRAHDLNHLMTYHPPGTQSSAAWFHNAAWLAFNTYQSGHGAFDNPNADGIARTDWARSPVKPTLNSEPVYEDIPQAFWNNVNNPRFTDHDVRKDAYRSLFGGAFGHTYGHNSVWQMYKPGDTPLFGATEYWNEVLNEPGATHMTHVRSLLVSRPVIRVPDDTLLSGGIGSGDARMRATRGTDYAFVYFPKSLTQTIVLGKIAGASVRCHWFDTRTGAHILIGTYANSGTRAFTPPSNNDWVLVLDNAAANFSAPGVGDLWYGTIGVTDSFSWVSTPSTLPQTGSFTVQIAYSCAANRDIVVNVADGAGTYHGHGLISRSAGTTGTATVTVPIQGTLPVGPALLKGEFRPAGGIWSDSLINIYAYPTVAGASGNVHGGTWAARGAATGTPSWSNLYQQVSGLPTNTSHVASFWMKGSGKVTLRVVTAGWGSVVAQQQFTATSTWTQYSLPAFSTAGNTSLIYCFSDSGNVAGTFYLDDAFLGVSGGANKLANPGYESGATSWSAGGIFSVLQNP